MGYDNDFVGSDEKTLIRMKRPFYKYSNGLKQIYSGQIGSYRQKMTKSSQVTFIYIALLTIQIVTKHCTISK